MNFRSFNDLNNVIVANLTRIPRDIDLIVGIPRSGLLVANLLAMHLNLPMTDVDGLLQGRILQSGPRLPAQPSLDGIRKVLVVDDSVGHGIQKRKVKALLQPVAHRYQFVFCAAYALPEGCKEVDLYFEIVPLPRMFEWNVMHHQEYLPHCCIDIDGVLCRDPTAQENDDAENYKEFLVRAEPLLLPTAPVGWLVTCRLEKYRQLTREWLARYRVQYKELVMMNYPDKESRVRDGAYASFKAEVYRSTGAMLFIESESMQSREIARLSGKPVLCIDTREMAYPSLTAAAPVMAQTLPRVIYRSLRTRAGRLVQRLISKCTST